MRIAQLARKLKIKPADIRELIASKTGETLAANPNLKLTEAQVELTLVAYAPEELQAEPESVSEEVSQSEAPVEAVATESDSTEEAGTEEPTDSPSEETSVEAAPVEDEAEAPEVIRAEKQDLAGIKIVGKIDLPEPPAPATIEVDGVIMDREEYRQRFKRKKDAPKSDRPAFATRERKSKRKSKNGSSKQDLTMAEQKRREDEAYQKRLQAAKKKEKKARKDHYLKNHAVKSNKGKKKGKKTPTDSQQIPQALLPNDKPVPASVKRQEEAPKGALKRLWKWLNT